MKHSKKLLTACLLILPFFTFGQSTGKIFVGEEPYSLVFGKVQGQFLEGASMSPDGWVYFSDHILRPHPQGITGLIWRYHPETGNTEVFRSPSGSSNGLMFDNQGRLVVCEAANQGGQRITRTDMRTGISRVVTGQFDGRRYNDPNDLVIDKVGNIYFTDNRFAGEAAMHQPVHGVYKIDTAGTVSLAIAYIQKPNGIAISPDQKTLYITTSDNKRNGDLTQDYQGDKFEWAGQVLAYSILEDGRVTFQKVLYELTGSIGDGMAIDTEGNIYATSFFKRKIIVISPEGEFLDEMVFPRPVTNAAFGRGEHSGTLFVTGMEGLYEVPTNKQGFHNPFEELPDLPTFQEITLKPKAMDAFVGEYRINENFSINISRKDKRLFLQETRSSKKELFAYEPDKFFAKVINAQIAFHADGNGKIISFDLVQGNKIFKFERVAMAGIE